MYKPLSNATLERMDHRACADCPSASAAIRHLTDRVAELMLAIAQDDKSGECATYDAGKNAAEIRELKTGLARHLEFLDAIEVAGKKIVADNARLRKLLNE